MSQGQPRFITAAGFAKLRAEGVTFLEPPYALGGHRAVLIEGPSREAIELVEIR